MKKLTDMIKDAEAVGKTGGLREEAGSDPLFSGFCDFLEIFDEELELFKVGSGETRSVPPELEGVLMDAFALGAIRALTALKHGYILKDGKDKVFYSLEELLSEAEALICPEEQAEDLKTELLIIQSEEPEDEDDDELELGDEDLEDHIEEVEPPRVHRHLH
jgi:hypothetical protein